MNCFPCKGPGCNSCGKFDRIDEMIRTSGVVTCRKCASAIDFNTGACPTCGEIAFAAPGSSNAAAMGTG